MSTCLHGERASGHRALRRGRSSVPGQTYLVTFTTHQRVRLFDRSGNAAVVARSLHSLHVWRTTALLAWTVMPDHLHLLFTLSHADSLQGVVQKVKSNAARELKSHDLSLGQVWVHAFHGHALRRDEDVRAIA